MRPIGTPPMVISKKQRVAMATRRASLVCLARCESGKSDKSGGGLGRGPGGEGMEER